MARKLADFKKWRGGVDQARDALARNGRQRCLASGYSSIERAREMLAAFS